MAIESFLPAADAKKTVEKKVKPKLSTAELTTIESPGKPMPASLLEKKTTKRKTLKNLIRLSIRNLGDLLDVILLR